MTNTEDTQNMKIELLKNANAEKDQANCTNNSMVKSLASEEEDDDDEENEEEYMKVFCKPLQPSTPKHLPFERVDFETYVKENCRNKLKLVRRETFAQIRKPIIVNFNHFNEYCAYHTKWLDRIYQLAVKYGEQIEFLVGDIMDIDVMYPKWKPLDYFCKLVRPENESPYTFAIDAKKRTIQHYETYKTLESLMELCENLLNGSLYPSQPAPLDNDRRLVKLCVADNYDELVRNSRKDVFLIVGMGGNLQDIDPNVNYDEVAKAMHDYSLDICYIDHEKNYVPYELNVNSYPRCLFISKRDKNSLIPFDFGPRNTAALIDFLKKCCSGIKIERANSRPEDMQLNFEPIHCSNLEAYLEKNYQNFVKLLTTSEALASCKKPFIIITVMDFQNNHVTMEQMKMLHEIFLIADQFYDYRCEYYIVSLENIGLVHKKLKAQLLLKSSFLKTAIYKVYGINQKKQIFDLPTYKNAQTLYYLTLSLQRNQFYFSQPTSKIRNSKESLKLCVADNLLSCIALAQDQRNSIFLCIYKSQNEKSMNLTALLKEISMQLENLRMPVVILKMNASFNYVDIEYSSTIYPVYYFISSKRDNSSSSTSSSSSHTNHASTSVQYKGNENINDILKFIKDNLL